MALKTAGVTPKKNSFALKRKDAALKRACCGEEEEEYCCCFFCRGVQNISVTNMSEDICVKIMHNYIIIYINLSQCIQGVTGGMDQTSGECSLGQTIPI